MPGGRPRVKGGRSLSSFLHLPRPYMDARRGEGCCLAGIYSRPNRLKHRLPSVEELSVLSPGGAYTPTKFDSNPPALGFTSRGTQSASY
jgi:hypothetical protein